jgi:amidase
VTTLITALETSGSGPRLAVKDLIDLAGTPTTAGSRAVARQAEKHPATVDAACLAGARAAGARIVGKANLHELALGASGVNPWFGTPVNPLDAGLVPGGSSSGSAVAVAAGVADIAYGSDTGGSVRIPSACCGTVGLKTTHGRISLQGVWPLAQTLDTIGPMARDVAGTLLGMQLLEPGFVAAPDAPTTVGRFRQVAADPVIEAAIDDALRASGFAVVDIELPGWNAAVAATGALIIAEAYRNDGELCAAEPDAVSEEVAALVRAGNQVSDEALAGAFATRRAWRAELRDVFGRVEVIALPTLAGFPPALGSDGPGVTDLVAATFPWNLAGVPALALPVPAPGGPGLPASLQLVGPEGAEDVLLAAGAVVEAAVSR